MKLYKHLVEQPFVVATGVAALVHSTWSLGTLFAGPQPDPRTGELLNYIMWVTPALLIAFALDIGQIATSVDIRAGHRTRAKYATFIVLAAATYYLQWLYISHHMPLLALAPGVRDSWGGMATLIRDAAIWIVPMLLPLSTTLYTMSSSGPSLKHVQNAPTDNPAGTGTALVPVSEAAASVAVEDPIETAFPYTCPKCGWHRVYLNERSRESGANAHIRHCPGETAQILSVEVNGHVDR